MSRSRSDNIGRSLMLAVLCVLTLGSTLVFAPFASAEHTRSSSAAEMITNNWQMFFSGKTSANTKISLLQSGTSFKQVINAQSASSLARSSSAKVLKVTDITSSSAKVTYNVLLAGQVALRNQRGQAVHAKGRWLVGARSFCALLKLEGTKTKACASRS